MIAATSRGTLTFFFADLESSTRLWEESPRDMQVAMERHDAILRAEVEGSGGRVVKTTGDGAMAAFTSACDAVTAALRVQQRLLAEEWPGKAPIRARVGLHSGEAHERDGDYFGPPVNRAARIMSAGHGGQVLMSSMTAELALGGGLPTGAGLRDLGEHRLKDLLQPERIFGLTHPDLPADLPAPRSLGRRPHNLPIQHSELIGREAEVAEIQRLLDSGRVRLLTLTGPGGIGKTRLALQAAADQIDRFADGVFFVDISGARDRDAVLDAMARTVGLVGRGDVPAIELLTSELADRQMMLVIDNFEQVMAAADTMVELLRRCPGLTLIITSREALRVRGEQLYPIGPLPVPAATAGAISAASIAGFAAVRLFVDRAQAARPDFELTDASAVAVLEICTRLDGLPLALELAAARLKLFSPDELAERLRHRLEVLRGGPRDLPARQQTLRQTIDWSYELLDENEQLVFRLLSVFGGARIDAVEAVASDIPAGREVDVVDVLSSLVDKSLVRSVEADRGQRLVMLETIREYAAERLAADPALGDDARRAHAAFFSRFARDTLAAGGIHGSPAALDELAAELANLGSAWRELLGGGDVAALRPLFDGLWLLHERRGLYHVATALAGDLLEVLGRLPATPETLDEEVALRMSLARGLLAVRGYTDEVESVYHGVLELLERAGQMPRRLSVLRSLANFHLYRGELDRVAPIGRQLLQIGEEQGDERMQLEGHFIVGVTTAFAGDVPAGQRHLQRATALFDPRRHGPTRLRLGPSPGVTAYTSSALIHWFTGQLDSAERQAENALRLAAELEHPYSLAYGRFHVGLYSLYAGQIDRAHELARAALEVSEEHEYAIWRALGAVLLGVTIAVRGDPAAGLARGEAGLALYKQLTTPPIFWPNLMSLHAATNGLNGRWDEAHVLVDEALALSAEPDLQMPFLMLQKGELLIAADRFDDAVSWLRRARDTGERLGVLTCFLRAAAGLVRLNAAGAASEDRASLARALASFSEGRDSAELREAEALLGPG